MGEQNISYETEGLVSVSTQITRDRDEHGDIDTLKEEIQAWREERGMKVATIGWLFSGEGLNMVFTRIPPTGHKNGDGVGRVIPDWCPVMCSVRSAGVAVAFFPGLAVVYQGHPVERGWRRGDNCSIRCRFLIL